MKRIDGLGFLEYMESNFMILDGASGTYMHQHGMKPGLCPETFAIDNPGVLRSLQTQYLDAGSKALYTFTMGGNALKLAEYGLGDDVARINKTLAELTVDIAGQRAFVGGDISSTGSFLKPLGDLDFEQAVAIYAEQVEALAVGGVDFIIIETMIDIQEARAAVIAAKDACDLPVVVSMTFDEHGRTLTGTTPEAAAITLISAGADVVGLNCSTGPAEMVPLVKAIKAVSSVPIIVKPNAGMPRIVDGETQFDMSAKRFTQYVKPLCEAGANMIGGCCGTDADYIRGIVAQTKDMTPLPWRDALPPVLTSVSDAVTIGGSFRVIGERINPTGKQKLKDALKAGEYGTVMAMAADQKDKGAHILDVNVGMPDVDEMTSMKNVLDTITVKAEMPLCIDSSKFEVVEQALRMYPGRALVNSMSTKSAHMKKMLPLIQRYQAMFILLPIGDDGIPQTADGRIQEIEKAWGVLSAAGVSKDAILVDGLVMAVSSDPNAAEQTLKVVRWCTDNGFGTVLGISNGSFGLPERGFINAAYLVMAIKEGLSAAIMNPSEVLMMDMYHAAEALSVRDDGFERYISRFSQTQIIEQNADTVADAVVIGKKNGIVALIDAQLESGKSPNSIIGDMLIPALEKVGDLYEQRVYFLPQLIYSAEAATVAFEYLESKMDADDASGNKKKVVIATVRGDVHDIGKNLVAMLLRNHGFAVTDLGKDVPTKLIVDTAQEQDADIIGLSALITTTAKEMEGVIALVGQRGLKAKVMVGGAVVTQEYADSIGADAYAADAAGAVRSASKLVE